MVKRLTKRIASDWKSPPEFEAEDSNLVDFGLHSDLRHEGAIVLS